MLPSKCSHSSLGLLASDFGYRQGLGWQGWGMSASGAPGFRLSPHKPCLSILFCPSSHLSVFPPGAIWLQTDSGRGQEGSDSGLLWAPGLCVAPGAMCLAATWCPSRKALILLRVTKLTVPQEYRKRSKDVGHTKVPRKLPSAKCYRRHTTPCQARGPEE